MVTFPTRDGTQSQTRNSQRILAVPWDRRIPKIRISTQQADTLQVSNTHGASVEPKSMQSGPEPGFRGENQNQSQLHDYSSS